VEQLMEDFLLLKLGILDNPALVFVCQEIVQLDMQFCNIQTPIGESGDSEQYFRQGSGNLFRSKVSSSFRSKVSSDLEMN
jgi:hypothetical protein